MQQNKYQQLFSMVINSANRTLTVEIQEKDLPSIKSGLSKLKQRYNEGNKSLPAEFCPEDITGNFSYTIDFDAKPSMEDNIVVTISIVEPQPVFFKLITDED